MRAHELLAAWRAILVHLHSVARTPLSQEYLDPGSNLGSCSTCHLLYLRVSYSKETQNAFQMEMEMTSCELIALLFVYLTAWQYFCTFTQVTYGTQSFTCNWVLLYCGISTFTLLYFTLLLCPDIKSPYPPYELKKKSIPPPSD